jgi:hypothetical protein
MAFGLDELKTIGQTFYNAGKLKEFQAILEAQQRIFDLQEENSKLRELNKNFGSLDKFEKSLIYEKGAYYSADGKGIKEGPFCPVCWGGDKKKIRMRDTGMGHYCDRCKASAEE